MGLIVKRLWLWVMNDEIHPLVLSGGYFMIKKIAVGYARYSSAHQREESIVRQVEAIRDYCQQSNLELVEEYIDEAQSGTTDRRDQFQKMMGDAMIQSWDFIVVYKLDRLSRSVADAMHYKKKLSQVGIRVLSVIEDFDESTPEGNFFNLITMGISEFYVKNLAREAFAGQMQNAKRALSAGGPPPLGYQFDKDKRLVIEPTEAEAVKLMFSMFVEGHSIRKIAKTLNEGGYRTRYGNLFTLNLRHNLINRKYIGEFVFNQMAKKNIDGTRNHTKVKPENEIVRVPHAIPQLIDVETFEKAQKILAERKRSDHKTYTRGKYLLTGLVKCGHCQHRMSGHTNRGGKKKEVRVIYRCRTKQEGTNCQTKAINILYLDAYILKQLKTLMHASNRAAFFALYHTTLETLKSTMSKKLKENKKIIELYMKERENLQSLMRTSKRTLEKILTEQMQEIETELHHSQVLQSRLKKDIDYLHHVSTDDVEDRLVDLNHRLSHLNTRKEAVFELVREIILHIDVVHIILIFNSFLDHEIEEEMVFSFTEKRKHIAFKTHHHHWRMLTT